MVPTVTLEERIRAGRHSVIVGALPPLDPSLEIVTIRCDAPPSTFGPLERACTRIDGLLGHGSTLDRARDRVTSGLRRTLLASLPWQLSDMRFVDACNRLAHRAAGRAVVLFEAFDDADEATFAALGRVLREPGWLKLPVILAVRGEPEGALAALAHLMKADPADAVVVRSPLAEPSPYATVAEASRDVAATSDLPADVLRVLRAAAIAGPTFEVDLVAELLDEPVERVLEAVQQARDCGVPIEDRSGGTLMLPSPLAKALVDSILPSLRTRWHERLAAILDGGENLLRHAETARANNDAPSHPLLRSISATERVRSTPQAPTAASTPDSSSARAVPRGDALRAAVHLTAAGQRGESIARRLDAVDVLNRHGDAARAAEQLAIAMQAIEQLPATRDRALLTARALFERGKLSWLSLCPAPSLQQARSELESARDALPDDCPPRLRADVAAAIAGVLYDIGDSESNARALSELSGTAAALVAKGETLEAARLMADEAAFRIRGGDAGRAVPLLVQSRSLFERRLRDTPRDILARAEIAGIDHTLARLPLYLRPSREDALDAYRAALGHAAAAERAYTALGLRREIPRIWETMARLESRIGERAPSEAHLTAALRAEEALGDLTGVARTTAALAEILAQKGDIADALNLLAASIQINDNRGSAIGLAADARVLTQLQRASESSNRPQDPALREALVHAARTLADARQKLGDVEGHSAALRPGTARFDSNGTSALSPAYRPRLV